MNKTNITIISILSLSFLSSITFSSAMDIDSTRNPSHGNAASINYSPKTLALNTALLKTCVQHMESIDASDEFYTGDLTGKIKHIISTPGINLDAIIENQVISEFNGIKKPQVDPSGPLFFAACFYGYSDLVEYLIPYVDISKKSKIGWSPLFAACRNGYNDIVELIINSGHNVRELINTNNTDQYGGTPLTTASAYGYANIIQMLISAGADVNLLETSTGASPLRFSSQNNHTTCIGLLTQYGAIIPATSPSRHVVKTETRLSQLDFHTQLNNIMEGSVHSWYSPPGTDMLFALFNGILEIAGTPENQAKSRIIQEVFGKGGAQLSAEAKAIDKSTQSMQVSITSDSFLQPAEVFGNTYSNKFKEDYNARLIFGPGLYEDKIVIEHLFDFDKNWKDPTTEDFIQWINRNRNPRNVKVFSYSDKNMNYYKSNNGVKLLSIPFEGSRYEAIFRYNPTDSNDVKFITTDDFNSLYAKRSTSSSNNNSSFSAKSVQLMHSVKIPFSSLAENKIDFAPILAQTRLSTTYKNQFDTPFFNKRSILEVKISQEVKKAIFNNKGAQVQVISRAEFLQSDSIGHHNNQPRGETFCVQGPYSLSIADLYTGQLCFLQKITDVSPLTLA